MYEIMAGMGLLRRIGKIQTAGLAAAIVLLWAPSAYAVGDQSTRGISIEQFSSVFLLFAIILLAATVSNVVERFGQPPVVGQLMAGIALSAFGYFGWQLMQGAASNTIIAFLANFGAIILLLSAGAESSLRRLTRVGVYAIAVAVIGVMLPFLAGAYMLGPLLFPGQGMNVNLFLGAALAATSVGISVAIFHALGIIRTRAAQTVLAAAIFDDILGLIILAVVSELATTGDISTAGVVWLTAKAIGFLFGALAIGRWASSFVSKQMSKLNHNASTKLVLAVSLALILGYIAQKAGMQPIIGAFAAGLLLEGMAFEDYGEPEIVEDLVHLRRASARVDKPRINRLIAKHRKEHLGGMIDTLGSVAVPVFFVYTGLQVDFSSLFQPKVYAAAALIAAVAIAGKILAGFAAQGSLHERIVVGLAMVPRGEVGLIFATTAKAVGVFDDMVYSTVVLAIILTTLAAPPVLLRLVDERREVEG